jgi:anaerobic magnesium-protoporphyrin IX monomethyl ester cyclase
MKILLSSGNQVEHDLLPLGHLYVASYLRLKRPQHKLFVYDRLPTINEVLSIKPDIACFGPLSIHIPKTLALCKEIKECLGIPIVLGGGHVSLDQKLIDYCDIVVIGEGELTFVDVVDAIDAVHDTQSPALSKVSGIMFRCDGNVIQTHPRTVIQNLDDVPYPARDLVGMTRYLEDNNWFGRVIGRGSMLISSRGCPFHCAFCASSSFWQKKMRCHSAEYLVGEIEKLIRDYDIRLLYIADDNFLADRHRLRNLAKLMQEKNIALRIGVVGRLDSFDYEMAGLLHTIGVEDISFGLESGSSRLFGGVKDRFELSLEKARKTVEFAVQQGFTVTGMFMIGIPDETEEDIYNTFDFIDSLPLNKLGIALATPFPGTEWWDLAIRQKIIDSRNVDWKTLNLKTWVEGRPVFENGVSRERLHQLWQELEDRSRNMWSWQWQQRKHMASDGL